MNPLPFHLGILSTQPTGAGIGLMGIPTENSAKKQLSGSADEVVKTIASLLDQMVMRAIDKRTAEEFRAVSDEVFPKYMQLVISLAAIGVGNCPNLSVVSACQ